MSERKLERWRARISAINPVEIEDWIRGLLIHYFFHVSEKSRIELFDADDDAARRINILTPTTFKGRGKIRVAPLTVFGVPRSPGAYSCSYIEARTPNSMIEIGDRTVINNRASFVSEGAHIRIGKRGLFGPELHIFDSNGHRLELGQRHLPDDKPQAVEIGDDVFIGSRVTILKGAHIGNGCVISAGCVVPPSFEAPPFSILAGNPARIVGQVAAPAT